MNLGGTRGRDDYREAIQIYENIAARYPKNIWLRAGLITTLDEHAGLLNLPDDAAEADASFRRSLAVAEGLIGDKDADAHCFSTQLVRPFNNLAWELVCRRTPAHAGDVGIAVRLRVRPSNGSLSRPLTGTHLALLNIVQATSRPLNGRCKHR